MNSATKYPRVLIIYLSCINKEDQHGVSIREWFADWPKENLAQIYSGFEVGEEKFCGHNFMLGPDERRFGKYFFKLKKSSIGQSSYTVKLNGDITSLKKFGYWSLFKNKVGSWLIDTGLWELIFSPVLSRKMTKFVLDFNPEIIYCQGYSLTFATLPVMLKAKFSIPICFQTGDDWPSTLYRNSPLSAVIRPKVKHVVKSLLEKSSIRFANGMRMANEYKARYGLAFETLMMCDNPTRFSDAVPRRVVDADTISIIYSGNIGAGRWNSIIELCEAAKLLNAEGLKIIVTIFATSIPPQAINQLRKIENLRVLPGTSHEELPSYLKGGDILFLPETFDSGRANEIRLSISTKAHFYMMSKKPVLVYSSPITGIADYAKKEGWAYIVEEQDISKLAKALRVIIKNTEYSKKIVNKGLEVVSKNHVAEKVRANFLERLSNLTNISS